MLFYSSFSWLELKRGSCLVVTGGGVSVVVVVVELPPRFNSRNENKKLILSGGIVYVRE